MLKGIAMSHEEGSTGISERRLEMRRETGESEKSFIDLDELLDQLDVAENHGHLLHNASWCTIPFVFCKL